MRSEKLVNRPIAVDLFAGAGGMTLGFEQAGFDVLAAVEIDPIHCATHKFNFPFWTVLCKSVTETTGAEIRKKSSIGNRRIDVVFGGPPCQGFSLIGKRSLDDPRNHLVFHFIRLVLELKPKYFVIENVKGMTLGKHREFIDEIVSKFIANNYSIQVNYRVLNAAEYGVPQKRERLFLLGSHQDLELPKYPQPITSINHNKTLLTKTPTVWEAIGDLPEVENYAELYERDWILAEFDKPSFYASQLRFFEEITDDRGYKRNCDRRILTSSLRTKHSPESRKRFQATLPGKTEPISHFHKLDSQGLSNTLRAGTASNRGAFTSPRPIHPVTPRCITVREAARLHSYPDWFGFHTTKWHGFRQIGNSVPPLLAKAVAEEIIKALGIIPNRPKLIYELGDRYLLQLNMSAAAKHFQVDPHGIEPRIRKINK
jgi:DNA (cytosine-5)-methyltransferase 1